MSNGNDQLRTELDRKFQPPIDVLLDPSLLVSDTSLNRLSNSKVFDSQTQATLGQSPTDPRIGELYAPAAFRELIESEEQLDMQKTTVWNFYRGQAEGAFRDQILDTLEQNRVSEFSAETTSSNLQWENALDAPDRQEQLIEVLDEEVAFLQSGGIVLSRFPRSLETLRDAGVPTIDVGRATIASDVQETLTDIGYKNPAKICAFGASTAESTTDALVGSILSNHSDLLLYRLGT